MKIVSAFSILLLLSSLDSFSQENYISNSDFEDYNILPTDIGQGGMCMKYWISPALEGGGDYFHSDTKSKKASTAKNFFGKQAPHSGKAYTGICITSKYREYLQAELKKTLEKGRRYKIELYISKGDEKWLGSMSGFCILFTPDSFRMQKYGPPMGKPPVVFRNEAGYSDTENWVLLSAEYEANGTERFLTFGSFIYRERTDFNINNYNVVIPGKQSYAHYYIDDFTLTPMDGKPGAPEIVETKMAEPEVPKVYETGKAHIFKNIVFESGKADLLPSSFEELDELAAYLNDNPSLKAIITGHTDNVGKKEDNLLLSKNRAVAVISYLSAKQVVPSRVIAEGKGDAEPVASNSTEEGKALNRRVEVVFH